MRDALALAPVSTDPVNITKLEDCHRLNGQGLCGAVDAMTALHGALTDAGRIFVASMERAKGVRHATVAQLRPTRGKTQKNHAAIGVIDRRQRIDPPELRLAEIFALIPQCRQ